MFKTGKKIDKINFNKFTWYTGNRKKKKKKNIYIYIYIYIYIFFFFFLGSFSGSRNEKKIEVKKKKTVWQLVRLLPNWVTIQWKLYRDIAAWAFSLVGGLGHDTVEIVS